MKKIIVIGVVLLFICGCDNIPFLSTAKKIDKTQKAQPIAVVDAQKVIVKEELSPIKGELLAQVDDWRIGVEDFNIEFDKIKGQTNTMDPQEAVMIKRMLFEGFINNAILAKEAISQGIDKEPEIKQELDRSKRDILARKLGDRLFNSITISEDEAKNKYEEIKNQLRKPEARKVKEIVVASEDSAKGIMLQLLKGDDFSTLAKDASTSDTKDKGGDLGDITIDYKGRFDGFLKQVFSTEKGATSNYFKGPKGEFYIIKVEDIKGGEIYPFDEVKDRIKTVVKTEKARNKIREFRQKINTIVENGRLIGLE